MALSAVGVALVFVLSFGTAAASSISFSAHGSADQVYMTGLAPFARMSLLNGRGRTIATKSADSLGGLLFREELRTKPRKRFPWVAFRAATASGSGVDDRISPLFFRSD